MIGFRLWNERWLLHEWFTLPWVQPCDLWRNYWTAYRTCRIRTSYQSGRFRARICKRLWNPEIDSEESIQLPYVAWRAGSTNRVIVPARQAGNRLLGSLTCLQIRALYKLLCSLSHPHRYTSTPTSSRLLQLSSCIDTSTEPYTDNYGGLSIALSSSIPLVTPLCFRL
jgi:hypothetical protein